MELYAGLDIHSRNTYIGIMDKAFNRVFKKRVPDHLEQILQTLDPFRDQIKGFVVESTYNLVLAGGWPYGCRIFVFPFGQSIGYQAV
jgi:hypothetical protein